MILFSCSWAGTLSPLPGTPARSRRSRSTPGATGRSRRRCGTCSGRRAIGRWRRCSAARRIAVPAYASWGESARSGQRAEDAHALVEEGFRAVKVEDRRASGSTKASRWWRRARAAVGDRLDIMVDLNQWWRMPGDIARGLDPAERAAGDRAAARYGVMWVEEPLAGRGPARDAAAARAHRGADRRRRDGADVRGAAARALDEDALDVFQPDVVLALGISGARTLAELALRRNRWFTPHTWTNGIGLLANLHVCAGVGGGPFIEFPTTRRDGRRSAATSCCVPVGVGAGRDGLGARRAGAGRVLDEEAVAFYARAAGDGRVGGRLNAPGRVHRAGEHGRADVRPSGRRPGST